MNLEAAISVYGGGPGSGCNPEAGKCGRPSGTKWDFQTPTKKFHSDSSGRYYPDRAEKHDQAVLKYEHKPTQLNPKLTILLGGTASGKSTYDEKESAMLRDPSVIDVDKMRADLDEFKDVAGTPKSELLLDEARDVRTQVMMAALAHNNDIALEAVGHPDTPGQINGIEKAGYKIKTVYIHRPVEESITLANKRADSSPTLSGRIRPPESLIRENHQSTRAVLGPLMKSGREVTIYDGTGKWGFDKPYDVIYHRGEDGKVDIKNDEAIERMRTSESPEIPKEIF